MSDIFDAGDLIGLTLRATDRVSMYRSAYDSAAPVGYFSPGQTIGVIDTYIEPNLSIGRGSFYWGFLDSNRSPYYVRHGSYFDTAYLRAQGARTVEEKQREEELKGKPWYEQLIIQYGPWILGAGLAMAAIRGYFSRKMV